MVNAFRAERLEKMYNVRENLLIHEVLKTFSYFTPILFYTSLLKPIDIPKGSHLSRDEWEYLCLQRHV
jgi:hypothetical protein